MQDLKVIVLDQLRFISLFGNSSPIVILSFAIIVYFLLHHKHFKTAIVSVLASFSYVYSLYLKELFKEQRPDSASGIYFSILDKYSFPSTHVVFYTVFLGFYNLSDI